MEKLRPCIYRKITVMKKVFTIAASFFLVIVAVNAQKEKKEPPPPPLPAFEGINSQKDFLKRNPSIFNVNWQTGKQKTIILKFKSGTEERYDLTNKTEQKNFTGKYGTAPIQPPPPPKADVTKTSPPIIIDEKVDATRPYDPPVITVTGKKADDFYKRNPTVAGISRKADVITLKMKNGTTETYDMNKKADEKKFTDKYGASPIPPPPPPPPKKVSQV